MKIGYTNTILLMIDIMITLSHKYAQVIIPECIYTYYDKHLQYTKSFINMYGTESSSKDRY